ncbi:MAG: CHRD domain-containing protein, partial [Bacteroidota bacterium]|nr:CHRD domain-containing protein [Bacteroidota bacterium]
RGQILPETDHAFVADMSGMQEVPMVMTDGRGLATFLLAKHNGKLTYRVVVNGLSGPITGAHLHMGAMGEVGDIVLDLGDGIMGNTIMGETDPTDILEALMDGDLYINVHTAMHPGGEIRGQVMMVHGVPFDSWLDGMQEVPEVMTMGHGVASVVATADLDSIWYDVQLHGLTGPAQGAHFHLGDPGMNGDVVVDLTSGIMGDRIQGWLTTTGLNDPLINQLLRGSIYINVHTEMHPNGEIRGQVYRYMREGYTVDLSGTNEVPMNMSTATGGGIVTVDRDQTNAHIMVVTDAMDVQAAHLHEAMEGEIGDVIFDLGPGLMNNGIFMYWTEMSATPFVTANSVSLRNNMVYVNVHTTAFPDGEVRGQVMRGSPCSDLSTGLFEAAVNAESLRVYPVPSDDQVTILLDAGAVQRVAVYNAQGQMFELPVQGVNGDKLVLDISDLQRGAYMVVINSDQQIQSARFIRN